MASSAWSSWSARGAAERGTPPQTRYRRWPRTRRRAPPEIPEPSSTSSRRSRSALAFLRNPAHSAAALLPESTAPNAPLVAGKQRPLKLPLCKEASSSPLHRRFYKWQYIVPLTYISFLLGRSSATKEFVGSEATKTPLYWSHLQKCILYPLVSKNPRAFFPFFLFFFVVVDEPNVMSSWKSLSINATFRNIKISTLPIQEKAPQLISKCSWHIQSTWAECAHWRASQSIFHFGT